MATAPAACRTKVKHLQAVDKREPAALLTLGERPAKVETWAAVEPHNQGQGA